MGGAFEERFLRFCVARRFPRARSRGLWGAFKSLFSQWRKRSLKGESVVFLYLDAIALRVRIANKVVSAPVLVAVGVKADGEKVVLDLELVGERVQ